MEWQPHSFLPIRRESSEKPSVLRALISSRFPLSLLSCCCSLEDFNTLSLFEGLDVYVFFPTVSLFPFLLSPRFRSCPLMVPTPVQSRCTTGSSSFVFSGGKVTVKNPARAATNNVCHPALRSSFQSAFLNWDNRAGVIQRIR